jgi:hypothetical protein
MQVSGRHASVLSFFFNLGQVPIEQTRKAPKALGELPAETPFLSSGGSIGQQPV